MTSHYDAIIVGSGHNGLVAANYLALAGLTVAVVEARYIVGGACVTEELIGGAKFSSCAFVQGTLRPEVVDELRLGDFGLEMTAPDVQGFALFPDGTHFFLWKDIDRTVRELEKFSRRDAQGLIEFGARFLRFEEIMRPFRFLSTPPGRGEVMKAFDDAGEAALFNEFVLSSTRNLLDRYFVSEHIKGLLTLYGLVSVWAGPDTPEGAYVYGYHAAGEFERTVGRWAFVKGGMGGITQSLARAAESRGVDIRVNAPVEEILIGAGGVTGVRLKNGETIGAGIVLSNAHPKITFLKLLGEKHLNPRFRESVERIDTKGSMARIHLLVDRLPHYVGFDSAEKGPQHEGLAVLGSSVDNFQKAFVAQMAGEFSDDYAIELVIQSATDPTLAPKGLHTITLGVQNTPFELASGTWDARKEEWGDHVCELVFRYAPNLRGHILGRHIITPLDLEREYRPDRRQHLPPAADAGIRVRRAAAAELWWIPHPGLRALFVWRRNLSRRRGDGDPGTQCGERGARGPRWRRGASANGAHERPQPDSGERGWRRDRLPHRAQPAAAAGELGTFRRLAATDRRGCYRVSGGGRRRTLVRLAYW